MDLNFETLRLALLDVGLVLIALVFHEWGHARMADRLGDHTPRSQGRVSLNPLVHIDLIGTIAFPLLGRLGFFGSFGVIGWAKPVETNPNNFKNRTADSAWVTFAGPGMNLVLAVVTTALTLAASRVAPAAVPLLVHFLQINISLFVFNLLPIPPLDGSKFLMYWFGMSEELYMRLAQWGWVILLVFINLPPCRALFMWVYQIVYLPFAVALGMFL